MTELTNVTLLEFIDECIQLNLDERAAFNALRTRFEQNNLPGRSATDRQQAFTYSLAHYRDRPAALRLALRNARTEQLKADLMDAFDRCNISDADLEDHYTTLQKALSHHSNVPAAIEWLKVSWSGSIDNMQAMYTMLYPSKGVATDE